MIRILLWIFGALGALLAMALMAIKIFFGGGQPFADVSTPPLLGADAVEVIAELDRPPACVAVSSDGRIFFDLHAFGHPKRFDDHVLFELIEGKPVPYPTAAAQAELRAPFGLTVDDQQRLWTVESGGLEGFQTRVLAFDLISGRRVIEHRLPEGVGQFAQDLRVTPDGQTVILADTGLFKFTAPSILAIDAVSGEVRATFKDHPSLEPQDFFIRRFDGEPHRLAFGLISFQVGVDGLSISDNGEWLYYATMSHGKLYRLRIDALLKGDAASSVQEVADKPQSDGIEIDASGRVYITDIENQGLAVVEPDGQLKTLVRISDVIWADSVAIEPSGSVLFTDSAIPAYVQPLATPPPPQVLRAHRPFKIYRVKNAIPHF
ncbi:MAG: hypothetical protein AAF449_21455 [Myxococcota bacterium]